MDNIISPAEKDLHEITTETEFAKAIKELFSKQGLTKKTELRNSEVNKLAVLYAIARKYKFTELEDILDAFLELRISVGRKGRKEIVDIARSRLTELKALEEQQMKEVKKL